MDKKCTVPNCTHVYLCKGYCSLHYQRLRKYGDPLKTFYGDLNSELCSKCQDNERRDDHSWCQPCLNELSRHRSASEKGPRFYRYKLTKTNIIEMKIKQNNSCSICGDNFDTVDDHVDHDNSCCAKEKVNSGGTCGECVRDLLCGSCNQGLGNFKDSIERMENAIRYLRKWK